MPSKCVRKPHGTTTLERPRCSQDSIKMEKHAFIWLKIRSGVTAMDRAMHF
jgi:hypothetical protein